MASSQTQKELVRLLVLEHGHQRASELSQIPYATVRQWSSRGKWKVSQSVTNPVSTIVQAIESELEQDERETRLSLSRSARRLSKDAETVTLRDSKHVKNVAQTAAIIHKWDAKQGSQANVMVNVAILGIDPDSVRAEADIIDQA